MRTPAQLTILAEQTKAIYDRAAKADSDLYGCSVLDLVADNLTEVNLRDLMDAIVISGIYEVANNRIRKQIRRYSMDLND